MNTSENGEIENLGETTKAVSEQADEPTEASHVEVGPDESQAAEPVQEDAVVGRRNDDLPTDGGPAEEPVDTNQDSSDNS